LARNFARWVIRLRHIYIHTTHFMVFLYQNHVQKHRPPTPCTSLCRRTAIMFMVYDNYYTSSNTIRCGTQYVLLYNTICCNEHQPYHAKWKPAICIYVCVILNVCVVHVLCTLLRVCARARVCVQGANFGILNALSSLSLSNALSSLSLSLCVQGGYFGIFNALLLVVIPFSLVCNCVRD
jgi:hypothetical protein